MASGTRTVDVLTRAGAVQLVFERSGLSGSLRPPSKTDATLDGTASGERDTAHGVKAATSAFTSAGSARVMTGVTPSVIGVTTVVRPGRWRITSGTRTVMLVAVVMLPTTARPAGWR